MTVKNRMPLTVTLPIELVTRMKDMRKKTGAPISQQVQRGMIAYLREAAGGNNHGS